MYSFYTSLFFFSISSISVNISSLKYFTSKCNNLDVNCFEMTFLIGMNLKCDYNIELCNILSFDCGPLLFSLLLLMNVEVVLSLMNSDMVWNDSSLIAEIFRFCFSNCVYIGPFFLDVHFRIDL